MFTALETVVKYIYFCTLLIATYEALKDNPPGELFRRLTVAFAPLLVFQILSVATGLVKASELDGSRSYIGGYNHEAPLDRKSTRLNASHQCAHRMPSSA